MQDIKSKAKLLFMALGAIRAKLFSAEKKIPLISVVVIYVFILMYLKYVLWPICFFALMRIIPLYEYLSTSFISAFIVVTGGMISFWVYIILLAGVFNPSGLLFFKNKKMTPRECGIFDDPKAFWRIFIFYICMLWLLILIFTAVHFGFFITSEDYYEPLYLAFSSGSFKVFSSFAIDYWPYDISSLSDRLFGLLLWFVVGYHWLAPRVIIVGIQRHIWRMKFSGLDF